jgi:hypothetical protein
MGSDGSDINESDRYYDHNGPYDPYGRLLVLPSSWLLTDFASNVQLNRTQTRTSMSMVKSMRRPRTR